MDQSNADFVTLHDQMYHHHKEEEEETKKLDEEESNAPKKKIEMNIETMMEHYFCGMNDFDMNDFVTTFCNEPLTFEPKTLEPMTLEPTIFEPMTLEPTIFEPTIFEPMTLEPMILDPILFEPMFCAEPMSCTKTTEPVMMPSNPTRMDPELDNVTTVIDSSNKDHTYAMTPNDSSKTSNCPIPQVYACSYPNCTLQYVNKRSLTAHVRTMHSTKRYRCIYPDCSGYQTHLINSMYLHIQKAHFGVSKKNCTSVPKVDQPKIDPDEMKRYFEVVILDHEDLEDSSNRLSKVTRNPLTNLYHCPFPDCDLVYSNSSSLRTHRQAHFQAKRYQCSWPECSFASCHISDAKNHIRAIHLKVPRTQKEQLEMGLDVNNLKAMVKKYLDVLTLDSVQNEEIP